MMSAYIVNLLVLGQTRRFAAAKASNCDRLLPEMKSRGNYMAKKRKAKKGKIKRKRTAKKIILKSGPPANPVFVLLPRAKKRKPRCPKPERHMIFLRGSMVVGRSQIRS
jgi:hypothetical protein